LNAQASENWRACVGRIDVVSDLHPLVDAARRLAPLAAEHAERAEQERRLPRELSDAIAGAGLYRMCVPASLGGAEAPPGVLLDAVVALSAGDASAGWCLAVCATSGMLAAYLPEDAAREVYGDPGGIVGGVFAPAGQAKAEGDALTVSGRWRFASNAENCGWLMVGCRLADSDSDVRLVLFSRDDVEIVDTWHVSGLRGTGSHDIAVESVRAPLARSASLITETPRERGPLYAFPPFGLLAVAIAAVALGTARGALDDVVALARAKTPTLSTRKLADRPATQTDLARAEASLHAARALLREAIDACWQAAATDGEIPLDLRASLRMAATHATEASAAAVDTAWRLAGGSAIYEDSPLQRRFRDVHAATQHMVVGPATWELAGRVLLGLETDDTQL
jgi:alkylation response protein AidB-like acyl-CoA dehydrogenase